MALTMRGAAVLILAMAAAALDDLARVGIFEGPEALQRVRSPATVMKLHLMADKGLKGQGAVCLDGTDAGFYFAPAAAAANARDWQLYFEGGGWCYDEVDCWGRAATPLGSSSARKPTMAVGGLMSDDCAVNPDFCNFNRVYMFYCDGNSFSGNRDEPLAVTGPNGKQRLLYFRGRRVLDAVLETLLPMGLGRAERVLLTGCSAGGLATYLHTDYVHGRLQAAGLPLKKFGAVPISGAFLLHKTVEGKPVYATEMRKIFELANSTHGLNDRCIAAMGEQDRWRCNFAEHAYAHTQAPIFPLNSALDSWSTGCILASELPRGFPDQHDTANGECGTAGDFAPCAEDPEKCSAAQVGLLNAWIGDFQRALNSSMTYRKAGNGAFFHSCHTHCEAQDDHMFTTFAVGGVSMQQAVSQWWRSSGQEPAEKHTYLPCEYHAAGAVKRCNPTCGKDAAAPADDVLLV